MEKELRILMVEDVPADAELEIRELKRAGLRVAHRRVDTEKAFREALPEFQPDVILSDFSMPRFDGMRALALARELVPDVPFIFVSGTIGEEYAIRALKSGAVDYVIKNNLLRLPVAVERALQDAKEHALRRNIEQAQARLIAILEATPDMVGIADTQGRPIYLNAGGRRMLGIGDGDELPANAIAEGRPPTERERISTVVIPAAIRDGVWSGESIFLARDGREVPVSQVVIAHKDAEGNLQYLSIIARDITEHKEQQAKIERLNRVYAVLSGINTTIVRTRDRQKLFEEACRIAVDHGKFVFAWIGLLDADTRKVNPVAKAGRDDGYLSQINLTAKEDAPGNCELTAHALTGAAPVVCNDIAADERMKTWRAEALKRGYRSIALLPLVVENRPIGVFVLYAPEPGVFDDAEMKLLVEMADDISFALDHIGKEERLDYLAYYDVLTGLPNRALFYDRANQLLRAAKKQDDGRKVAIVLLDLERFRTVSETFGRGGGDAVLREVAERLAAGRLGPDHLARIGADVFAAVLVDIEKEEEAVHFVEQRVIGLLHKPIMVGGQELRISAKAGIVLFPADGADVDTLVHNAEAALKKAKLSGDRYLFYSPEFNARVAEKLTLENKMRRALERRELTLHYQPVVNLAKGNICGLEALMRWNDPDLGPVPPARFIPVMEETGLILEAGRWALEQAVADFGRWQADGQHPPRVAVNVSQVQLRQKDFVATVQRALNGAAGAAGVLELEITESLIMQDVEANIGKLKAVRDMGVEVAIDDFGTGFSSLSYIAKLPINVLKIDRAFIMNLTRNPGDVGIVTTMISLAHSLDLKVVAEGVETEEQANLLRLLKCDQVQGYLFSPAVPAERIGQFLREKKSLPG